MVTLELTEEQVKKLEGFLDLALRTAGMASLADVVDFVNVLQKAKKMEPKKVE